MKKINENCSICGNEIDEYTYYVSDDKQYYCCEECMEKAIDKQNFKGDIGTLDFSHVQIYLQIFEG